MSQSINKTIKLNNGKQMPVIGLGLWKTIETEQVILWAFEAGYRLIDTATIYGNEKETGNAVRKSGIARSEIFITTKVWNDEQGYKPTLAAIDKSLSRLNMDYIDLYLVHWPNASKRTRQETWVAMEEIYRAGKAKAIGVSNYSTGQLEEMKTYAKVMPVVNQIELHPFWSRVELMDYCHNHNIAVEGYCPLARARKLQDERLMAIAKKHNKTSAQIALKWALQHGNIVIPKTSRKERLMENISLFDFELDKGDMMKIDALNENYSIVSS
jgi:diketogulonate reductase-like aldo/keto reductase